MKTDHFFTNMVSSLQILSMSEVETSSFGLNPTIVWARFILTDDKPNANKKRVPKEEFSNLITSGVYMPIKMADGRIDGHPSARPIGVITHLREDSSKGSEKVVGLAALWSQEHPENVGLIRDRYQNKKPLDLSWEISYAESDEHEDGIVDLKGTILTGVSIVAVPAYQGRTFIEELFSSKSEQDDDDNHEETELKDLETLQKLVDSLEASNKEAERRATEAEGKLAALESTVEELSGKQITDDVQAQLDELAELKKEQEQAEALAEKTEAVKAAFKDAEVELDDKYFEEHSAALLEMDEAALGLLISTLKRAKSDEEDEEEGGDETSSLGIPRLPGQHSRSQISGSSLGKQLRKARYQSEDK